MEIPAQNGSIPRYRLTVDFRYHIAMSDEETAMLIPQDDFFLKYGLKREDAQVTADEWKELGDIFDDYCARIKKINGALARLIHTDDGLPPMMAG